MRTGFDVSFRYIHLKHMRTILPVVLRVGLALGLVACSDSSSPGETARFVFREALTTDAIRVEITNPAVIDEAKDLLQSGQARWVLGTPRAGDGGFNTGYTWHLDPASISFAEVTIEACQTAASAVADDLDYWIGFGQVCVWGTVENRER